MKHGFSVIGISETKITEKKGLDFNPNITGYSFEYVPTPLAAGGVGRYVKDSLNYAVIERTSKEAFQALWIEIQVACVAVFSCAHLFPSRLRFNFLGAQCNLRICL